MRESLPLKVRLRPRIELRFPHFERHYEASEPKSLAYSFEAMDGRSWYDEFAGRIFSALTDRRFLPVYRMCDGEFIFALKGTPEDTLPWWRLSPDRAARRIIRRVTGRSGHQSGSPEYGFERYSAEQRQQVDAAYIRSVRFVAESGILALCLHTSPLSEPFVAAMCDWFDSHQIPIHRRNYYHFYSVYALLHGPDRARLLEDRRVLIVTGLTDAKRDGISAGLRAVGVRSVEFLAISPTQSMLDTLDLSTLRDPDLVLVGAGVGAANVLAQLEPLGTVCLDVGFALSTIAKPDLRWNRPYCVPDAEFDLTTTRWSR